jgi:hypothetical protein
MSKPRGMVRGYTGYYNGIYLRSSLEFAYAYYLDYHNIKWEYEKQTFELDNSYYKPDFFIIENGNVIKIVEIKGEGNFKLGEIKCNKFQDKYNIPIEMLTYKDLVKLYQNQMPIKLNTAKRMWIDKYSAKLTECYLEGKYNPMYGVKQKESTKVKISEKAKLRFENKEYKKAVTSKLIEFNRANNFACAKGERSKREIRACQNPNCSNKFEVTIYSNKKYCSLECACVDNSKLGADVNKKSAKELRDKVKNYILDWSIENKGLIIETKFNKITTTLKPLYKQIEERFGIKDERIISKSLMGEDLGRKEFLKHLKEWVS